MSRPSVPPEVTETVARAICGNDADPQLFARAIAIAENEIVLQAIRAQQIASFERFQGPYVMPFGKRGNARKQIEERDEYAALEAAIVDLIRLDRYQRRAWSRQKKAIRELLRTTLMSRTVQPSR
jgi:hypothetical protein